MMEDDLDVQESALAMELKDSCNEQGAEIDVTISASIFLKLGDVYWKKFRKSLANDDVLQARFDALKSAALYQAVVERSQKQSNELLVGANCKLELLYSDIVTAFNISAEASALLHIVANTKQKLKQVRSHLKKKFLALSEPSLGNDKIRNKFAAEMEGYQMEATRKYTQLIKSIFDDVSVKMSGDPPCSFAVLGLGSLARFEVTPYSDFESILVLEKGETLENSDLEYFRNYSMLSHLVVIGLGETIIPAMAIQSLNDFEAEGGDWFVDVVTKRGLSFDGLIPHACKNPLGRLPTKKKPWHTELIKTVDDMLRFVDEDLYLKEGYHLAEIIVQSVFVHGGSKAGQPSGRSLGEKFQKLVWERVCANARSATGRRKVMEGLQEDLRNYSFLDQKHGKAVNVKKDLYRGITILLPRMAILVEMSPRSSYEILEKLTKLEIMSREFCSDLKIGVAIANYVRCKTYFQRGAQHDTVAGGKLHSKAQSEMRVLETLPMSALQHLFRVGTEFQASLSASGFLCNQQQMTLKQAAQFSLGSVMFRFEQYDEAIKHFLQQLEDQEKGKNTTEIALTHLMLGRCYYAKSDYESACYHFGKSEKHCQDKKSFERGRILLFRALGERKLRGTDIEHFMEEAQSCFMKSDMQSPDNEDIYNIQSFVETLQKLCNEDADLVPELIEVMVMTGDRLLKGKLAFLALPQYQNALYEMEKYYKDRRHEMLSTYVMEAISVCEGRLGRYEKAVDSWLELMQRIRTMSTEASSDISFKRNYNPTESLRKNLVEVKAAVFGFVYIHEGIDALEKMSAFMSDWVKQQNNVTLLSRISAILCSFLGELYEKAKLYCQAYVTYMKAKALFSSVFTVETQSHSGYNGRINRCFLSLTSELDTNDHRKVKEIVSTLSKSMSLLQQQSTEELLKLFTNVADCIDRLATIEEWVALFLLNLALEMLNITCYSDYKNLVALSEGCQSEYSPFDCTSRYEKLESALASNAKTKYGKLLKTMLCLATEELCRSSTVVCWENRLTLAGWLEAFGKTFLKQNMYSCAKLAYQRALYNLKTLTPEDVASQFSEFCSITLDISNGLELCNSPCDLQSQRNILLNHPCWNLPDNLSHISALLRTIQPPYDGITEKDRLIKLPLEISSSAALRNWKEQDMDGGFVVNIINSIVKFGFALPEHIASANDLQPLAEALQTICEHPLVRFATFPRVKTTLEVQLFLASLTGKIHPKQVVDTLLCTAAMYMQRNHPVDSQVCLKVALKQLGSVFKKENKEYQWYMSRCFTDLSWCYMQRSRSDKAWIKLGEAVETLLRFHDTKEIRNLKKRCRSRERTKDLWQSLRESVSQFLDQKKKLSQSSIPQ